MNRSMALNKYFMSLSVFPHIKSKINTGIYIVGFLQELNKTYIALAYKCTVKVKKCYIQSSEVSGSHPLLCWGGDKSGFRSCPHGHIFM